MLKKSILKVGLFHLLLISPFFIYGQQEISPYLFGQNAWAPNEIFKVEQQVKAVKYQVIRIGGNGYENAGFVYKNAIKLIDFARSVGAEPIFQLPRQLKDNNKAYEAVAYINGTMKRNIKLWSIGNEPDHNNQLASVEEVSDYFKKISAQIKAYDSTAKVIGFDLASYQPSYFDRLLGGDLDVTGKVAGKAYYFLDVVSFHGYKFDSVTKFEGEVDQLLAKLAKINSNRSKSHHLSWAITEFNSHWKVDGSLGDDFMPFNFHNGQIYAEVYDLGMRKGAFTICPWSMLEGGAHRSGTDLSLFDEKNGQYLARSNYYHTLLLAQNYRRNYLGHSPNSQNLKVVPMGDAAGMSIMVMNKRKTGSERYVLDFEKPEVSGEGIFINANIKGKYKGKIGAQTTQMLLFDAKGKLTKKINYSVKEADAMMPPKEN
ncbi:MAG: hypothetical protein EOO91_03585 [Pedobacter sp.]|nr:MAG: hypothetical protein EOO91_03585 [Pedobacter sp.]